MPKAQTKGEETPCFRQNSATADGTDSRADGHRYIFINNILCRTETSDGTFRPADVFVGLDPPPRCTATLGDVSPENCDNITVGEFDPKVRADSVSMDCSIFNVFGVMSGGVLVESEGGGFVDFTDNMIFCPPMAPRYEQNNAHYKQLEFDKIRGEGVISLVSSIYPYNGRGTFDTPLPWPRCLPRLRSSHVSSRFAKVTAKRILRRCVKDVRCNKVRFEILESYRAHRKLLFPQMTFLPQDIPFRFQWRGMAYRVSKGESRESVRAHESKTHDYRSPRGSINQRVDSQTTSRYSVFHTLTGLPKMTWRRYRDATRRDTKNALEKSEGGYSQRLEMRLQNVVHPIRQELMVMENVEVVFRSRKATHLWGVFQRYFTILGVKRCKCNEPNCSAWFLEDDKNVDYPNALRQLKEALKYRRVFNVSAANISDSWDWLLVRDKKTLIERIRKIIRYAKMIDAEENKRIITTNRVQ